MRPRRRLVYQRRHVLQQLAALSTISNTFGVAVMLLSMMMGIWLICIHLSPTSVPGFASVTVSMWFLEGLNRFLPPGLSAFTLAKVFTETKQRPRQRFAPSTANTSRTISEHIFCGLSDPPRVARRTGVTPRGAPLEFRPVEQLALPRAGTRSPGRPVRQAVNDYGCGYGVSRLIFARAATPALIAAST